MYKVLIPFTDEDDHVYNRGDFYPREGSDPTDERIAYLLSEVTYFGKKGMGPVIAMVDDAAEPPDEGATDTEEPPTDDKPGTETVDVETETADRQENGKQKAQSVASVEPESDTTQPDNPEAEDALGADATQPDEADTSKVGESNPQADKLAAVIEKLGIKKPLPQMRTDDLEAVAKEIGVDITGANNNHERANLIASWVEAGVKE